MYLNNSAIIILLITEIITSATANPTKILTLYYCITA